MIGGDSKSRVVRPICHVQVHAGAHTHTHTFAHVYTICSPQTQHIKNEILSSPMGVGVRKYKINSQSSKIDRWEDKTKDIFSDVDSLVTPLEDLSLFVFCVFVCLFDYMLYHMLEFCHIICWNFMHGYLSISFLLI